MAEVNGIHHSSILANGAAPQSPLHDSNRLSNGHTVRPDSVSTGAYGNLRGGYNSTPPPPPEYLQNNFHYNEASTTTEPLADIKPNGISYGRQSHSQAVQNPYISSNRVLGQQQNQEDTLPSMQHEEHQLSIQPLAEYDPSPQELEEELGNALQQELEHEWEQELERELARELEREFEQHFEPAVDATHTPHAALPEATHLPDSRHEFPIDNANTTTVPINNRDEENMLQTHPLVMSPPTQEATADFLSSLHAHMSSRSDQQYRDQQGVDEQEEEQRPGFIRTENNPFRYSPSYGHGRGNLNSSRPS